MRRKSFDAVLVFICIFAFFAWSFIRADRYDYVIKNGSIVDGTGKAAYRADIGIRGTTIEKIGSIPSIQAKTLIDASDMIVAPGFIDIHTHANVAENPGGHNYIMQGVTTVVGGNCGGGPLDLKSLFETITEQGTSLNFATFIGQNTIRQNVMGSSNRKPTPDELETMKELVAQGMRDGAVGMSNGLVYNPAVFADTDEIVALAREAAAFGGIYASHIRCEGDSVIESVKEAIEVGERAGIPVQISHLKVLSVNLWGRGGELLALIDSARTRGVDVTADQYPYTASSTGLGVLLPAWAFEGEGWRKKAENPALNRRMINDISNAILYQRAGTEFNRIQIAHYQTDPTLEGKGLQDIMEERGIGISVENAAKLVLDLLSAGSASAVYHAIAEDDVESIMSHPFVMHASDGHITQMNQGVPHPRSYGTFPRVLGFYVREKSVIPLEEAIRKMTSLPASRLGITNRGIIEEMKRADLVIFDPAKISDAATFAEPHSYPTGIEHVIINGIPVVKNSEYTGERPGSIIYGPGHGMSK